MEFIRGLYNVRPPARRAVMTIGNFDGLHAGHRQLIAYLVARAQALAAPSLIMIFEPQPREYFQGAAAPPRLMDLAQKLRALRETGVDYVLGLRFDATLAALPAADFIETILSRVLDVRLVVIGDDFRFGAGRHGDLALLTAAGTAGGFGVEPMPTFVDGGQRVSSTRLRAALSAGDLGEVRRLLGEDYCYRGRVVRGEARGRTLGFPTANLRMPEPPPLSGVFAVTVTTADGGHHAAVANVGRRPTFGSGRPLLEAHLLDFAGDLYGQVLTVRFHRKLRDERRFASLEDLRAAIADDRAAAAAFFARHKVAS
ncbi:MAG: bifunctional riboflavin kinase/FAD synthetase [Acidiferrobacter sp.]